MKGMMETRAGVAMERRLFERAWMGLVALVCAVAGLMAWMVAGLMCVRCGGCAPQPGMMDAAVPVPEWQLEQRAQMAERCDWLQANWNVGVYADEMADWRDER